MASQDDFQGARASGSDSSTTESQATTAAPPPAPEETVSSGSQPAGPGGDPDTAIARAASSGSRGRPPAPPPSGNEGDEDDGMLRMSFLEHLEELRSRIIRCLAGVGVAFLASLIFASDLWMFVTEPAADALTQLGFKDPRLAQITPMEGFSIIWVKVPMLAAIFLASPWVLYQVWAFIAPGLYKRERRWAAPFVLCSAGLFLAGGAFAYFIVFRYGLVFLLGIGRNARVLPMVSMSEYFDLFVNVMLGVGLVFELPILIFFLSLLRIVQPGFLLRHSRYAILAIVILAAIITPTPDVFNLMLFSVPMILLFFVGIFASYLLVLHRENRRFPWGIVLKVAGAVVAVLAAGLWLAIAKYGYHFIAHWPFLTR